MPFRCSTDGSITLRLKPKSKGGRVAKIQPGSVVWSKTEGDPGTLEPAPDGMTCKVTSPDALDADDMLDDIAHITATADGDVGEGVVHIEVSETVTFFDPNAESLGLEADAEVPKP